MPGEVFTLQNVRNVMELVLLVLLGGSHSRIINAEVKNSKNELIHYFP